MNFKQFKQAFVNQFKQMAAQGELFRTNVTGEELWDTYLGAYPPGSDPLFKTKSQHDCNCCKGFIRACGNVVTVYQGKLISVWGFTIDDPAYQAVADAMDNLVTSREIYMVFRRTEKEIGTGKNIKIHEDGKAETFTHFSLKLPNKYVARADRIGDVLGTVATSVQMLERALLEIDHKVIEEVLELIDQGSIYRGEEHKSALECYLKMNNEFRALDTSPPSWNAFLWSKASQAQPIARIRNTAIGTLLTDLSEGKELDKAVKSFELKVAPANYKRPKALITKAMIANAQKTVQELGLESALARRHARADDLTINNVLFADRTEKQAMNVFDELASEVAVDPKKYNKVAEVSIAQFLKKVLPKAQSIELQLENKHECNLMSLIAPANPDVKHLFKWDNNFGWAYQGEVADSLMKKRVKAAGGNISGVLRFSIMWNDGDDNQNDFDAHCHEPNGNLISYPKARRQQASSGMLDIDIIRPGNRPAVENIVWTDRDRMPEGTYKMLVHNFAHCGGRTGFTAEVEYDGIIHRFVYDKELRGGEKVAVAAVTFNRKTGFSINNALESTLSTKEIWGIRTNNFHRVRLLLNSPNHWDGEETGNKHWFFILEGCKNPTSARGFFNEFLKNDLTKHRKVFEVLGSKMRVAVSAEQLSGLGFSSTQRNSVLCKVTGKTTRVIRIKF